MIKPMNTDWHAANLMPKNPTPQQRIQWHIKDAKNCGCRPVPAKLRSAVGERSKGGRRGSP